MSRSLRHIDVNHIQLLTSLPAANATATTALRSLPERGERFAAGHAITPCVLQT